MGSLRKALKLQEEDIYLKTSHSLPQAQEL